MSNRQYLLAITLLFAGTFATAQSSYHRGLSLMGCRFDITVVADNEGAGEAYLDMAVAEIQRIENLISSWNPRSQTSAINQAAGLNAVEVRPELFRLIERSIALSELTDGAFDISYASMDRIWKFDGSMTAMPNPEDIAASVAKVGFERIALDPDRNRVFLTETGMKIGFGGIGKGYAADRAKAVLEAAGVAAGIINASGDLTAWGTQPNGEAWKVAISNPLNKNVAFAWLPVNNQAVVTSGNYEKYVRLDGQRYAHIIDPRTGYPSTGILSVTIIAPQAELADALATSVFVMGVSTGLDFIKQLPDVDCVIIDENNQIHASLELQAESREHEN